jgi:energy-coupling factor transporter ATP-binding protein EcfA2
VATVTLSATPHSARGPFTAAIAPRAERGEHIALRGPRGSGKTTLLLDVELLLGESHCTYSSTTPCLDDITRPLERADGDIATRGLRRRAARGRPAWVVTCAALAAHERYWRDGRLKARLLAGDTELSLRGAPDAVAPSMSSPRLLPTNGNRQ